MRYLATLLLCRTVPFLVNGQTFLIVTVLVVPVYKQDQGPASTVGSVKLAVLTPPLIL